jgi:hypothetical protein
MTSINTQRLRKTNSGAAIKVACQAASTANLTLSGEQTVDGIALLEANEDRVLCKDQTDATENGIYIVSTGAWTRAPDFNGSFDVAEGTLIPVSRGTTNADTYWKVTNTGTIDIGTTALAFSATTVLDSAILNDGSVKMIANFNPNVSATYSLGESTALWTSIHLSSAMNANSAAVSSDATVGGTLVVTGASSMSTNLSVGGAAAISSNTVIEGTLTSSGAATLSSGITASLLTTALSGTDPGVAGKLWVSTSTGATAGKFLLVSTGP